MTTTQAFSKFLGNIKVDNSEKISNRYKEITKKLNKTFRDTESETDNCLQCTQGGFVIVTFQRPAKDSSTAQIEANLSPACH